MLYSTLNRPALVYADCMQIAVACRPDSAGMGKIPELNAFLLVRRFEFPCEVAHNKCRPLRAGEPPERTLFIKDE